MSLNVWDLGTVDIYGNSTILSQIISLIIMEGCCQFDNPNWWDVLLTTVFKGKVNSQICKTLPVQTQFSEFLSTKERERERESHYHLTILCVRANQNEPTLVEGQIIFSAYMHDYAALSFSAEFSIIFLQILQHVSARLAVI